MPGRNFAIASGGLMTQKRWGSTLSIFRRFIRSGLRIAKGKNNSVTSEPGDPGVPYAIGSQFGGHKAVEPELGTLDDFDWLVDQVRSRGMEIALDFAINCSPDHPYVKEHPEWFFHRPTEPSSTRKIRPRNTRMSIH